jgi:hypothetical protein
LAGFPLVYLSIKTSDFYTAACPSLQALAPDAYGLKKRPATLRNFFPLPPELSAAEAANNRIHSIKTSLFYYS